MYVRSFPDKDSVIKISDKNEQLFNLLYKYDLLFFFTFVFIADSYYQILHNPYQ